MKKIKLLPIILIAIFLISSCNEAQNKKEREEKSHENHEVDKKSTSNTANESLDIPAEARVFFANLQDGDAVKSPVRVEFGVEGMEVRPAGELIEGTGHHHIIINGKFIPKGDIIPTDSLHIHFGNGQTEAEIELPKGEQTLTLQFADGMHRSYGEQLSASVVIFVE